MPSSSSSSWSREDEPIVKVSDERTPLFATIASGPTAEPIEAPPYTHEDDEDAPLPRTQIFLLCFTRVVEPIAFFSIFPYINQMIEQTGGIKKKDVGFYSGLIESLFSATQMCVMIFWGKVLYPTPSADVDGWYSDLPRPQTALGGNRFLPSRYLG